MKTMTELENIIMNRTVCDRATANLIANDILEVAERDFAADIRFVVAQAIFSEIDSIVTVDRYGTATFDVRELWAIKKKYTGEQLERAWKERRDAVIEEYLQRANGDVDVAIQLIEDARRALSFPCDLVHVVILLEAQLWLEKGA